MLQWHLNAELYGTGTYIQSSVPDPYVVGR